MTFNQLHALLAAAETEFTTEYTVVSDRTPDTINDEDELGYGIVHADAATATLMGEEFQYDLDNGGYYIFNRV